MLTNLDQVNGDEILITDLTMNKLVNEENRKYHSTIKVAIFGKVVGSNLIVDRIFGDFPGLDSGRHSLLGGFVRSQSKK